MDDDKGGAFEDTGMTNKIHGKERNDGRSRRFT